MLKKVLFIVNRKAGTADRKHFPSQVKEALNTDLFSYQIEFTEYSGHAIALARQAAAQGTDIIVAVGGDGSVNEVAQGVIGTSSALAIVPKGSGNGLARALHIPLNMGKAISVINGGKEMQIDAGLANDHLFLSNAGIGFDALIARLFADNKKRGLLNYARLVVKAVRHYQAQTYQVHTASGNTEEKAFFITIANGNQLGYNFKIAAAAAIDDGLLDICIVRPLRWWHLPAVSLKAFKGKLGQSRYAKYLRRGEVIISNETLAWMQVDGEVCPVTGDSITVKILPGALKVLVP